MNNLSGVRKLAGKKMAWRLTVTMVLALALSATVTSAHAQVAASHEVTIRVQAPNGAAIPYCNPAGHVFCAYANSGCTQDEENIPTADHSKWYSFKGIDSLYNPECIVNDTNSSVWVIDKQTGANGCAAPGDAVTITNGQFGYFYVKYNVGACGSLPPGE